MRNQAELTQATSEKSKRLFLTFPLLLLLFSSLIDAATAQVVLSVGYLNNLTGQPPPEETPFPFDTDTTNLLVGTGGVTSTHDTGVILIENLTEFPVTIDRGMRVTTDARDLQSLPPLFQIWDASLPIILPAGQSLVLAETVNFNFDTSDVGEFTVNNPPVVSGSVNGASFSFTDRSFVLLGRGDATNTPETTSYQQLGVVQPPDFIGGTALGLGAVEAECQDLNTNQVVRGSIVNGTLNCVKLGLQSQPGDRVAVRLRGLARSGGQLPPIIGKDKTTVNCIDKDGKSNYWTISTNAEIGDKPGSGKCMIVIKDGKDSNADCRDSLGETNAMVDCSRNEGRGGCAISNPSKEGGGECVTK